LLFFLIVLFLTTLVEIVHITECGLVPRNDRKIQLLICGDRRNTNNKPKKKKIFANRSYNSKFMYTF
jgi:hypothetical protein